MMMVSVLMSVYREPVEWVSEAITSVLEQSFTDFEFIIIIDDPENVALTDFINSQATLDSRIHYFINTKNLGLTKSINKGLQYCKGRYIIRMDADDISLPHRFQKQVTFMESNPDIIVSGTAIKKFGNDRGTVFFESDPFSILSNFVLPTPNYSPIAHPTSIIRSGFLKTHNLKYNESFLTAQDYALWNDIIKLGYLSNLQEVLLLYRVSNQQISSNKKESQRFNRNLVLRAHISHYLSEFINSTYVVPETIELNDIKYLKETSNKLNLTLHKRQIHSFLLCYYRSLNQYNFKSLLYFLQHDLFNWSWPLKQRLRILLSHGIRKFEKPIISKSI